MCAEPRRKGFSLLELLISSGLLLLLTTVLMAVLIPTMRHATANDTSQEIVQRLILTREFMARRLVQARFDGVTAHSLAYYLPQSMRTHLGSLNKIDVTEMIVYDSSRRYLLELDAGRLWEHVSGNDRFDHVLWHLGEGSSFTVDTSAKPAVRFLFEGRKDPRAPTGARFKKSFRLFLKNLH